MNVGIFKIITKQGDGNTISR